VRQVLVDANVFVSFLVERNESQRAAAKALIDAAGDGEIEIFITQFGVFEVTSCCRASTACPSAGSRRSSAT
jgi:predicted nucleic acid-binding protein